MTRPLPLADAVPDAALSRPDAPRVELSADLHELVDADLETLLGLARDIVADHTLPTVRAWTSTGRKAVACFPVYTPQEILHSMGLLPVTLHGGGETIDITRADAPLGSFLCGISKSTLELAIQGHLDPFSAFVFPYICDVSRNLEGVFSRRFPCKATHMLHLPQNFGSAGTVPFLVAEYRRLIAKLEAATGTRFEPQRLEASIRVFNAQRQALRRLEELKRDEPWRISLEESYLLNRLGTLVPRELHTRILENALRELPTRSRDRRDSIRVLLVGPFCEQPSLDLLQLAEDVGCYVVHDQLQMLNRWYTRVEPGGDPLVAVAKAYVDAPVDIGVRITPTTKAQAILAQAKANEVDGVLFFTAKFCEPALEDIVLYERALDAEGIPSLHLEFEERSSGFEQARLALETFVESILFD